MKFDVAFVFDDEVTVFFLDLTMPLAESALVALGFDTLGLDGLANDCFGLFEATVETGATVATSLTNFFFEVFSLDALALLFSATIGFGDTLRWFAFEGLPEVFVVDTVLFFLATSALHSIVNLESRTLCTYTKTVKIPSFEC